MSMPQDTDARGSVQMTCLRGHRIDVRTEHKINSQEFADERLNEKCPICGCGWDSSTDGENKMFHTTPQVMVAHRPSENQTK